MFKKAELLKVLQHHIGKRNGAGSAQLVSEIVGHPCTDSSLERHLRHLIHDLRMDGQHICAHPSTGYFIAESEAELNMTCDYLYERAMSSLSQIARMKQVSIPDLRGQLRLPT